MNNSKLNMSNIKSILSNNLSFNNYTLLFTIMLIVACCLLVLLKYRNDTLTNRIKNILKKMINNDTYPNNIENFQSGMTLVGFINKTNDLFHNNTYLQSMNLYNLNARNFKTVGEIINKYKDEAILDVTDDEKLTIDQKIRNNMIIIEKNNKPYYNYLIDLMKKSKLAKSKLWLENSMPHTHDNVVIINEFLFNDFSMTTFIHELTHVHQRKKLFEFNDLYEKWGFIYYKRGVHTIKGLERNLALTRNNPDANDFNWIWKNNNKYYWISAIFVLQNGDGEKFLNLTNAEYLAYELEIDKNSNLYYLNKIPINLSKFKEFTSFFQISNNHYHPNEIAAQYAEYYYEDSLVGRNNSMSKYYKIPAYELYMNYFNNLYKTYYN